MRCLSALLVLAPVMGASGMAQAETATVYATQPGLPAYDLDPYGGNPFASAVIAALRDPARPAAEVITAQTVANSGAQQFPDLSQTGTALRLLPGTGERATALVVVFADYGDDAGLVSLPGAAFDAHRVGAALGAAGYAVETVVARNAAEYRAALDAFAVRSQDADRALVYTTGHGFEVDGTVYIVPPDAERALDILGASLSLADVRARIDGPGERLLLYAGCRDNPLGLERSTD